MIWPRCIVDSICWQFSEKHKHTRLKLSSLYTSPWPRQSLRSLWIHLCGLILDYHRNTLSWACHTVLYQMNVFETDEYWEVKWKLVVRHGEVILFTKCMFRIAALSASSEETVGERWIDRIKTMNQWLFALFRRFHTVWESCSVATRFRSNQSTSWENNKVEKSASHPQTRQSLIAPHQSIYHHNMVSSSLIPPLKLDGAVKLNQCSRCRYWDQMLLVRVAILLW